MKRYSDREAGEKQIFTVASSLTKFQFSFSLLFCHKLYKSKKKNNYLNANGEEAKGKPPGL